VNWENDPVYQKAEQERRIRGSLIRSALLWTPLFLLVGGAFAFFLGDMLFGSQRGTWFLVVVLAILSFLLGYQSIHNLLDLVHGDTEMTGRITRRWSRSDSLVLRSHYIRVERKQIFRIERAYHDDVKEGDYVRVRYYPRSAVVIECEKLPDPDAAGAPNSPD
jgi:hypothetical protein